MKKQILRAIATMSFLMTLAAGSLNAQAQTAEKVQIPFDFSAGSTKLPAGVYTVNRITNASACLVLRNINGRAAAIILTQESLHDNAQPSLARMVFNRYGDVYFLSQVWLSSRDAGHQVPVSRDERRLSRELSRASTQPRQISLLIRR